MWIILGIWVVIGIAAGIFIAKKRKWGIAVVGAFGGVILGLLITTILGAVLKNAIAYYAVVITCGVIAFLIAFKVEKFVLIVVTSFLGSYSIIRGISMYAGGFPNETELHSLAHRNLITWDTFPKTFYGYLAGILVLSVLSTIYQYRSNKDDEKSLKRQQKSARY